MSVIRKLKDAVTWWERLTRETVAKQDPNVPAWLKFRDKDIKQYERNVRTMRSWIRRIERIFRFFNWKVIRINRYWFLLRTKATKLYRSVYSYVLNIFIGLKTTVLSIGWRVLVYTVESLYRIFYTLVDQPAHFLYKNVLKYYVDKYYYPFFHPYLVRWYYRVKVRLYKMWYSEFITRVILFIYDVYLHAIFPTVTYLDEELEVWTPEHKYYLHYRGEEALDRAIQRIDPDDDEIVQEYYDDLMEDADADEYEFLSPWWYTSTFDIIFWCWLPGLLLYTNISLLEDRHHLFLAIDDLYFGHAANPLFNSDDIWKVRALFTVNTSTAEAIDSKLWLDVRRKALSGFFGVNENSKFFTRVRDEFYRARKIKRPKPHFPCLQVFYGGWRAHTVTLPGMQYEWDQITRLVWAWKFIEFYFSRIGGFYYYEYIMLSSKLAGYFQVTSRADIDLEEWIGQESKLWGKLITRMAVDNCQFGRVKKRFKRTRWIEFVSGLRVYDWSYEDEFFEHYLPIAKGFTDAYRQSISGPWRELARDIFWNFQTDTLKHQSVGMRDTTYLETWWFKWGQITWSIAIDDYQWLWKKWSSKFGKTDDTWWYNERLFREFLLEGYEKRTIKYWLELQEAIAEDRLATYNIRTGRRFRKEYIGRGRAEKHTARWLQIKQPKFSESDWRHFIDRPGYVIRNSLIKAWGLGPSGTMNQEILKVYPYWSRLRD